MGTKRKMSTATIDGAKVRERLRKRQIASRAKAKPLAPPAPAPSPEPAPAPPPAPASGRFADHFIKLTFETRVWTGRRQARGVTATFAGQQVDEGRVSRPQVCLLPRQIELEISRARQACYAAFDRYTVLSYQPGVRVLGRGKLEEAVAAINRAVEEFHATADRAADRLDEIIQYNRAYWLERCQVDAYGKPVGPNNPAPADPERSQAYFNEVIGSLLPENRAQFRGAFHAEYALVEPEDIASRFEDITVRDFFEAARANAQRRADDLVRQVTEEPIQRLAEELKALQGRLDDETEGRRIDPRSFNGVGAAIKLLLSCGDAIHPKMLREVERFDAQLAETLENVGRANEEGSSYTDAVRAEAPALSEAIGRIVDLSRERALREEMLHRYGIAPRRIQLD